MRETVLSLCFICLGLDLFISLYPIGGSPEQILRGPTFVVIHSVVLQNSSIRDPTFVSYTAALIVKLLCIGLIDTLQAVAHTRMNLVVSVIQQCLIVDVTIAMSEVS